MSTHISHDIYKRNSMGNMWSVEISVSDNCFENDRNDLVEVLRSIIDKIKGGE